MKVRAGLATVTGEKLYRLWIPLAALLAVLPLLVKGPSCGHDFNFHLSNWMEVQQQWGHGVWLPRWHFHAAWGAGEPRLLFYPPMSWLLGAVLGSVLPWTIVPAIFTWIALTLSGFTMHRLARAYAGSPVAVFAACFYLANPYMLFVAYERTAYAELLAAAWMPLLLFEMLRPRLRVVQVAWVVALLWLTNAPAAVIGCYTLAFLAAIRLGLLLWRRASWPDTREALLRPCIAVALGLGLAAFYVVPAAYEQRWVQIHMATLPGILPWDSFLFGHNGIPEHDAILHTVSMTAVFVFGIALVCGAIVTLRRDTKETDVPRMLLAVAVVLFLLLTPVSLMFWRLAPRVQFLQFPWRLASMGGAVAAVLLALALARWGRARWPMLVCGLLLTFGCGMGANHLFRQYCDEEDAVAPFRAAFESGQGMMPTDEYTVPDADNDSLAVHNPPHWLAQTDEDKPPAGEVVNVIAIRSRDPYRFAYMVPAVDARFLILNLRAFHDWHVRLNGAEVTRWTKRTDGLFAIRLPNHAPAEIEVSFVRTTDQWVGIGLSVLSLIAVLLWPLERRGSAS